MGAVVQASVPGRMPGPAAGGARHPRIDVTHPPRPSARKPGFDRRMTRLRYGCQFPSACQPRPDKKNPQSEEAPPIGRLPHFRTFAQSCASNRILPLEPVNPMALTSNNVRSRPGKKREARSRADSGCIGWRKPAGCPDCAHCKCRDKGLFISCRAEVSGYAEVASLGVCNAHYYTAEGSRAATAAELLRSKFQLVS